MHRTQHPNICHLNLAYATAASKCKEIVFRRPSVILDILLDPPADIERVSYAKLLGIFIDCRLKFTEHVDYRVPTKKRGQRFVANILKTPRPNCVEVCELLQYCMLNAVITFLFKSFVALWNKEMNKSAITDHVAKENHVINWSGAKIFEREGHRKTRQVKESIRIRKEPTCMNRDGGGRTAYRQLGYDRLLVTCSTSTSRDHKPDEARRWRAKRRN